MELLHVYEYSGEVLMKHAVGCRPTSGVKLPRKQTHLELTENCTKTSTLGPIHQEKYVTGYGLVFDSPLVHRI